MAAHFKRESHRMPAQKPTRIIPASDEDRRLAAFGSESALEKGLLRDAPNVGPELVLNLALRLTAIPDAGGNIADGRNGEGGSNAEAGSRKALRQTEHRQSFKQQQ